VGAVHAQAEDVLQEYLMIGDVLARLVVAVLQRQRLNSDGVQSTIADQRFGS
jgi:hypothetical protein